MAESERDKMRRLGREAAERRRQEREDAVQRRLEAEAAEERALEKLERSTTDEIANILENELDADIADIRRALLGGELSKDEKEAAEQLKKAVEGGWLSGPSADRVHKVVKKNKKQLKSAAKKGKSGCWLTTAILAVISLSGLGGLVYGAAEVVSALM